MKIKFTLIFTLILIFSNVISSQNEEDIQKFGIEYVSSLVQTLMNNGVPSTLLNALTGELTPPGNY